MEPIIESFGVLVGADINQEWLLLWWWQHFRKHNPSCAVAFADFGLSDPARDWCRKNGILIAAPEFMISGKEDLPGERKDFWEERWQAMGESRSFWHMRNIIFKKPLVMLSSPFAKTVWLDIDCEVRSDLSFLSSFPLYSGRLTAASSQYVTYHEKERGEVVFPLYNSGVVLFEKKSPVLEAWAYLLKEESAFVRTDDDLLSYLLYCTKSEGIPLPLSYNWDVIAWGPHPDAHIYHWKGNPGKEALLKKIHSDPSLKKDFQSFVHSI